MNTTDPVNLLPLADPAFFNGDSYQKLGGDSSQDPPSQVARAIADIVEGIRLWPLWSALGWLDIRQRYRRSKIGPFWLTISMGVMIGAIGNVYGNMFKAGASNYLPHVAIGFVVWGFISGLANDGCNAFIEAHASIKQLRLPLSVYVYRVGWRNFIIFGHNFLIILVVAFIYDIKPDWTTLLALPAVATLLIDGLVAGLLLGLLSARFRDIPQIVAAIMQLFFFLTPIIWQPDSLSSRQFVLRFNPFFYAVEIVRQPLLGALPPLFYWIVSLTLSFVFVIAALVMYACFRRRIPYWL